MRKRVKRPAGVGDDRLPAKVAKKDPAICSRCGAPGKNYSCGPCKVALTVLARQRKETKNRGALMARRKYNANWMKAHRAAKRAKVSP